MKPNQIKTKLGGHDLLSAINQVKSLTKLKDTVDRRLREKFDQVESILPFQKGDEVCLIGSKATIKNIEPAGVWDCDFFDLEIGYMWNDLDDGRVQTIRMTIQEALLLDTIN